MSGSLTSIRVAGGLLPSDVLSAVLSGSLDGLTSSDYHLGGESPREAAARVWTHLLGVYRRFRDDLAKLPERDPAVGVTRERWLTVTLSELGYGRVPVTGPGRITVEDRQYPISHLWGATPIHLLGWGVPLDKRTPGVPGAAQRAPHAMVQELLNRTDNHLWAIVSNGRLLRLLRDSTSLTGQAYVEFDLESMFDGELFAEFALFYLLVHQSRVEVPYGGQAADCWLERWRTTAVSQGVRALTLLREGVQQALEILGTGFLQHPANSDLRNALDTGRVRLDDIHQNLLRIVYRLLFWAVAEDRDALLDPHADPAATGRYRQYFSSSRLRHLALRRHGSAHHDLWDAVTLVVNALGRQDGEPRLGLSGLGGLFSTTQADVLYDAKLGNQPLLAAVRALSVVQPKGQPQRIVDFLNLGAEELGSIYESLLELTPRRDTVAQTFSLDTAAGNDRKTSGSYYTSTDLVELVLDTALGPVLDDAEKHPDPEAALLAVTACDPAIGSGHFMVAAARRIATRLATVRTGEIDPTPTTLQDAMHDVVARCIYGVDINPMAADLAKVSLWLEAMSPGRPLSFLDHHIKVGNALLGTTPALLYAGIPDAAYAVLTGDDKATVKAWKRLNEEQRSGQASLFNDGVLDVSNASQRRATQEVAARGASAQTLGDITWAAQRYATHLASDVTLRARRAADAWCAAFLTPKTTGDTAITHDTVERVSSGTASDEVIAAVDMIAKRHRLFHWHLEFPEIFRVPDDGPANTPTGWAGGFTTMLGNPPWERVKLQEQEFFAARGPTIADAENAAARKTAIVALAKTNPALLQEFEQAKRRSAAESQFLRFSGRYPLCGVGDVNTYSVFAEHFRSSIATVGRSGIVTPTGLATDATTAAFFAETLRARRLVAFYDFENEAKIFDSVHHAFRFAVTCLTGGEEVADVRLAFYTRFIADVPKRRFALSSEEILMLNPNTGTLPVFRSRRDAEITLKCYRTHPILIRERPPHNPWRLQLGRMLHMADDASMFWTGGQLEDQGARYDGWAWRLGAQEWLPLYEAKMTTRYDHRYTTYGGATTAQLNQGALPQITDQGHDQPGTESFARYWVAKEDVDEFIAGKRWPPHQWLLGWRDIARAVDERTFSPAAIPRAPASGLWFAVPQTAREAAQLQAVWSSLVWDYMTRQKMSGTHVTIFLTKQLACPAPSTFASNPAWEPTVTLDAWVCSRVMELTYTSSRMAPYAMEVLGSESRVPPFRWIPARRAQLRAELDAAMLHLYSLDRDDAEHVLDSFFVVRRYEERDHGEYRTRRSVLREYDAMVEAARTGVPYRSPLDPPPGNGPRHPETNT